jgi:tetratricopeptide (TPR) repeat protein
LHASDPATTSVEKLIEAGHWKRARALLEAASPNNPRSAYLMARVRYAFGDYKGALPLAEKAVALNGSDAHGHLVLGRVNNQIATRHTFAANQSGPKGEEGVQYCTRT